MGLCYRRLRQSKTVSEKLDKAHIRWTSPWKGWRTSRTEPALPRETCPASSSEWISAAQMHKQLSLCTIPGSWKCWYVFSGGCFRDEPPVKSWGTRSRMSVPVEPRLMWFLQSSLEELNGSRGTQLGEDLQGLMSGFLWTLSQAHSLWADFATFQWDKSCPMLASVAPWSKSMNQNKALAPLRR